jgi:transcriptional regulator with XRE-family HTH domain
MKAIAPEYRKRDLAKAFGWALRSTRVRNGISQDQLSELCDVDRTYPSLLERGLRAPTLAMVFRIANALDVEPTMIVADAYNNLLRLTAGVSA